MIDTLNYFPVIPKNSRLRRGCRALSVGIGGLALLLGSNLLAADSKADVGTVEKLVPLALQLPAPAFVGTPQNIPVGSDVEPMSTKPRPPLMVPANLKNLAPGTRITCSDSNAASSTLVKITDGQKDATDETLVLVRKGIQFLQFDLGNPNELFAIVIWHAHDAPKVYRDVIVQAADDPEFTQNVRTLFNNDKDNSTGRGIGTNREYFETHEGKLVEIKDTVARYIRLYSRGSTESVLNEYTEVEIYGRPPK